MDTTVTSATGPTTTLPELAAFLSVSTEALYGLRSKGRGPRGFRVGRLDGAAADYARAVDDDAPRTPAELFGDFPDSLAMFHAVEVVVTGIGEATVTTGKSQVAFRRRTGFAYAWRPGQYIASDVPLVLSIALPHEVRSARFKSVVHPSRTVWMHHIELRGAEEIDDQVTQWLAAAYANAA